MKAQLTHKGAERGPRRKLRVFLCIVYRKGKNRKKKRFKTDKKSSFKVKSMVGPYQKLLQFTENHIKGIGTRICSNGCMVQGCEK
jgi:hypothetical protein